MVDSNPMKLFQYWDTGEPPPEVDAWIESFRTKNPEMRHRLYDRGAASWFIGKHFGERERRAFDACAIPSTQSDYFRLCAIIRSGGIYVDADLECVRPLASLVATAPHSLMLMWDLQLVHSFMMYRAPSDPFLCACLELATRNIEDRWPGGA